MKRKISTGLLAIMVFSGVGVAKEKKNLLAVELKIVRGLNRKNFGARIRQIVKKEANKSGLDVSAGNSPISVFYPGEEIEFWISIGVPPTNQSKVEVVSDEEWTNGLSLKIEKVNRQWLKQYSLAGRKTFSQCAIDRKSKIALQANRGDSLCVKFRVNNEEPGFEYNVLYRAQVVAEEGFWKRYNTTVTPYIGKEKYFVIVTTSTLGEESQRLLRLGHRLRRENKKQEALGMYSVALFLSKKCIGCLVGRALIHEERGEIRDAIMAIEKVLAMVERDSRDYIYYQQWKKKLEKN